MEFNNLSDVLNCMKEWETIRNDSNEVVNYLNLGNYFSFTDQYSSPVLHAYPGVAKNPNEFYMFLIPRDQDIPQSEAALFNAITICKVDRKVGDSSEIPENIAKERIDNWKKDYTTWAENQISKKSQTQGLFQAFYMPSSYMQANKEYITYFALKNDTQAATGFDADLITTDEEGTITYYDTVKPVPPFSVAPASDFYLLQLAEQ